MAKVKVTTKFQILDFIDNFVDGTTASAIGRTVTETAKEMIASGQSPVRGYGRFDGYSDSYKKDIKGTLGKRYRKTVRPVNLLLTGEMLDGYDFEIRGDSVFVGMVKGSEARKEIAGFHNDGTPNMPQRKIVPSDGEEWAVTIMREIRDIYGKRLSEIIRQSGKKV